MATLFNQSEREYVILWCACESLDSILHHQLLSLPSAAEQAGEVQVDFPSTVHQDLFTARVLDFLENATAPAVEMKGSCLDLLRQMSETGTSDQWQQDNAVVICSKSLQAWLEKKVVIKTWFPSIGHEVDVQISREEMIRLCGNIAKHSIARLSGAASWLADILLRSGVSVDKTAALLALPEFNEKYHRDILSYHTTTLVELLNNLRWAIHDHLGVEFAKSYCEIPDDPPRYRYRYPESVENEFARICYWDVMNSVRRKPYLHRFTGYPILKLRY